MTENQKTTLWTSVVIGAIAGLMTSATYIGVCLFLGRDINPVTAAAISSAVAASSVVMFTGTPQPQPE